MTLRGRGIQMTGAYYGIEYDNFAITFAAY